MCEGKYKVKGNFLEVLADYTLLSISYFVMALLPIAFDPVVH
jgi:hypothetical protein